MEGSESVGDLSESGEAGEMRGEMRMGNAVRCGETGRKGAEWSLMGFRSLWILGFLFCDTNDFHYDIAFVAWLYL